MRRATNNVGATCADLYSTSSRTRGVVMVNALDVAEGLMGKAQIVRCNWLKQQDGYEGLHVY